MTISDETLMAYVDGELDNAARTSVEAAMATDPELARRVVRQQALRNRLRATFDPVLAEPVPEQLLAAAHGTPASQQSANVIRLNALPRRTWSWPQWGGLAACLLLGVLVAPLLHREAARPPVAMDGRGLLASGALAQALSQQLASDQRDGGPVRVGISFRSQAGTYCRTFELSAQDAIAGVACREGESWRLQALAASGARATGTYQPAASRVPAAIAQTVNALIAGEPLDDKAEAAARGKNWQ